MNVVDDLNLKHGIIHQDIAPRNLLIDPSTDNLMLFDFDWAARVGSREVNLARNDIKGVIFTLYEILTQDNQPRNMRHEEQDVQKVQALAKWDVKTKIESGTDVKTLRLMVTEWAQRRRGQNPAKAGHNPPLPLRWPRKPPAKTFDPVVVDGKCVDWPLGERLRRDIPKGERIVRWERTPYSKFLGSGGDNVAISFPTQNIHHPTKPQNSG
jgi:serine/threonine protein kinase